MTPDETEEAVWELIELHLNLEGGVMMMPLKASEISALAEGIIRLVRDAGGGR